MTRGYAMRKDVACRGWLSCTSTVLFLVAMAMLSGCANLHTISRRTSVPFGEKNQGRVIHLDAQQRVVVFAAAKYCAEPSPDALAAYAAALGVAGAKLPNQSLAASMATGSMAGSIGLRTQSITLMRDTLYRTCEAALNGYLSDPQVAVLMARSQDLTAVILAIEQLTGAVAAPPINLSTSANASGASSLMASTEALNAARATEAKAKEQRDLAETKRDAAKSALDAAVSETAARRVAAANAPDDADMQRLLKEQLAIQEEKQQSLDVAEVEYGLKNSSYEAIKETADQIAAMRDSTMNATTASISGLARSGEMILPRNALSAQATTEIANTVETLVEGMMKKSYFADACMAVLMMPSDIAKAKQALESRAAETKSADPGFATLQQASADRLKKNYDEMTVLCLEYFKAKGTEALR